MFYDTVVSGRLQVRYGRIVYLDGVQKSKLSSIINMQIRVEYYGVPCHSTRWIIECRFPLLQGLQSVYVAMIHFSLILSVDELTHSSYYLQTHYRSSALSSLPETLEAYHHIH